MFLATLHWQRFFVAAAAIASSTSAVSKRDGQSHPLASVDITALGTNTSDEVDAIIDRGSDTTINKSNTSSNDASQTDHRAALAGFYLRHEMEFLIRQSEKLGGFNYNPETFFDDNDKSDVSENLSRLKFMEQSLKNELEFVRSLKKAIRSNDLDADGNNSRPGIFQKLRNTFRSVRSRNAPTIISIAFDVLSDIIWGATWSSCVDIKIIIAESSDEAVTSRFENLYFDLECDIHAKNQNKELYTSDDWFEFWKAFRDSTLFPSFMIPQSPQHLDGRGIELDTEGDYFDSPFYIDFSEGKGRGAFASRNITKGSLVNPALPNTVFFLDGTAWFRFLDYLPTNEMKCDAMEWVWMQDLTNTGKKVMCLNMDGAAFLNHGYSESNIHVKDMASLDFYAMRDIVQGEELTYDYDVFDFKLEDMRL